MLLPGAIICPSQFITGANQEFTIAERQLKRTWAWTNRTFHFDTFLPKIEVHSKSFGFWSEWILIIVDPKAELKADVQMVSWVPVWPASCSTRFSTTMMMKKIHLVIVLFCSSRGRSFPIGAFTKGLTNCIGVSSTNRLWWICSYWWQCWLFDRNCDNFGKKYGDFFLKVGAVRTWRSGQMRAGPIEEVAEGEVGQHILFLNISNFK